MKMTVQDLIEKFSDLVGDTLDSGPDDFVMTGLNKAFNELPSIPKLDKLFSKRYKFNLAGDNSYRWEITGDFRRVSSIPDITFWDNSKPGDPIKVAICYRPEDEFFERNGLVELKAPGRPCEYTIQQEGDSTWLVFDRPIKDPLILSYSIYGYPKNVTSPDDEIELSAIAENLILEYLKYVWYQEAGDFAFAGSVFDILDNKLGPEALQQLYKPVKTGAPIVLGG